MIYDKEDYEYGNQDIIDYTIDDKRRDKEHVRRTVVRHIQRFKTTGIIMLKRNGDIFRSGHKEQYKACCQQSRRHYGPQQLERMSETNTLQPSKVYDAERNKTWRGELCDKY